MKKITLALLVMFSAALSFGQLNMVFRSNLTFASGLGGLMTANIGGYVDTLGNEYALVGTYNGLSIVDVTNPAVPVNMYNIVGPASEWREVKTRGKYAYVTTEGGNTGLQIIDLTNLPGPVTSHFWQGSGALANSIHTIHALHIDGHFLYLYGTNNSGGGPTNTIYVDLTDPWNPSYVGQYVYPGTGNDSYVHDGYVRNDTCYESHVYSGFFTVVDATDKLNPVLLAQQTTPTAFTHNTWLSDDSHTLFTTDENANSFLTSYDITNLGNITELDRFTTAPGTGAIVHNVHILNDYAVVSWYVEGVSIVDAHRPDNLIEVGKYDTHPLNETGFHGCWGVYPFLPSGTIVASDIENGLYVLTPTYVRACYLEGLVTDSVTHAPLYQATVSIVATTATKQSKTNGTYKTGTADSGSYTVTCTKPGYYPKTFNNVVLTHGNVTALDFPLVPITPFVFTGKVTDSRNGNGIPNAKVHIFNTDFTFDVVTNSSGIFTIPTCYAGTYDLYAGIWGFHPTCLFAQAINPSVISYTIPVTYGYADDFNLDLGWVISGAPTAGQWERGAPIGVMNGPDQSSPASDDTADCSNSCFVTGIGAVGDGPSSSDVDGGIAEITSPVFDATIYVNPRINYSRWFYNAQNGNGPTNDTLKITLSNGSTSVMIDSLLFNQPNQGMWVHKSILISDFMTPSSNMTLSVETSDFPNYNVTEGGFDNFEITGDGFVGVTEANRAEIQMNIYPNPSGGDFNLSYFADPNIFSAKELQIKNVCGSFVLLKSLKPGQTSIEFGKELASGMYFAQLVTDNQRSQTIKIIKTH